MIFLAGCVLVFGGIAAGVLGAFIESERTLKASCVAAISGVMLWQLSSRLSAAPKIMEAMP
jgi:hypothetical protein